MMMFLDICFPHGSSTRNYVPRNIISFVPSDVTTRTILFPSFCFS
jgi:hypothetical protein